MLPITYAYPRLLNVALCILYVFILLPLCINSLVCVVSGKWHHSPLNANIKGLFIHRDTTYTKFYKYLFMQSNVACHFKVRNTKAHSGFAMIQVDIRYTQSYSW